MEMTLRPARRAKTNGFRRKADYHLEEQQQARVDQRDLPILGTMWQMIPVGLASAALGFLIWNLDDIYCPSLRRWRRTIGLPLGDLNMEGHAWW